ncbi:MAG TPA: MFS transporter [Chlamydiales bacterium]|jgi:MFS family permease
MKLGKQEFIPSLSGFQFGYCMSIIAGALVYVAKAFSLKPTQEAFAASIAMLGAMCASVFAGTFANLIGRKQTLMLSIGMFLGGALLSAFAGDRATFFIGRFLVGIGGGIGTVVAPLYLVEIAAPDRRGAAANLYQIGIALGSLVAYLVAYFLSPSGNWRWMFALGAIPAILQGVSLFFIPESCQGEAQSAASLARWKHLLNPAYRSRIYLATSLSLVQALSGASAIFYFAPRIFAKINFVGEKGPLIATLWIGAVYLLCTWLSFEVVDRWGRRFLLLASLMGMILSLGAVTLAYVIGASWLDWIFVSGLLLNIGSYAVGLGPVPPLVAGEISPPEIRGHIMTIAGFAGWIGNYLVALTFLPLFNNLGLAGTFCLYIFFSILGLGLLWKKLPETKQKSLEEIGTMF